jgi:hypothetical protein
VGSISNGPNGHSSYNSVILLSFGVQIRRNRVNYELGPEAILPFFERRIRLIPQKTKARKLRTIIKKAPFRVLDSDCKIAQGVVGRIAPLKSLTNG